MLVRLRGKPSAAERICVSGVPSAMLPLKRQNNPSSHLNAAAILPQAAIAAEC
jgi:hypothetical protein